MTLSEMGLWVLGASFVLLIGGLVVHCLRSADKGEH